MNYQGKSKQIFKPNQSGRINSILMLMVINSTLNKKSLKSIKKYSINKKNNKKNFKLHANHSTKDPFIISMVFLKSIKKSTRMIY